ncbi:MAG: bifunctional folylpolyglutamate synthase/dihydrofolate synthase [Bryobacterales bacterium]|nr:bifunctional folylpolyglutamate synthase/dihydrofolate synthase [Bryobacterales bacterium]
MNYPDSVRFLYALGNEVKTAKLGLSRVAQLAAALGNPQQAGRIIHVAGTNGKGSVAAMIESGLRSAGYRTGLYTSPHLSEPTERIRIGAVPVSTGDFTAAFAEVHQLAEQLLENGSLELHPTYFETVTLMAFLLFQKYAVDWTVLEVGLGGRLDATNIVTPALTVITPVDYDHEAYLGTSLEAIAAEKAGILKPGVPAILGRQRPEAESVILERATELAAPVERIVDCRVERGPASIDGSDLKVHTPLPLSLHCPLPGDHQLDNALTAALALHRMEIAPAAIENGIGGVRWPGRLERVSTMPDIFLDGAHNPAGARALAAYIEPLFRGRRVWIVYGAMRDKAVEEITGILFPLASRLILTMPDQTRAIRPEALARLTGSSGALTAASVAESVRMVRQLAAPGDVVFFTGSLFLVGEARPLFVNW